MYVFFQFESMMVFIINVPLYSFKMANQRKRTYETYEQSRLYRRSTSSIYLAQSNSTLTASSQSSQCFDFDNDEGDWCADKMRKQRHKMEKLLVCYEQQRKCINELEEYIDELQKANNAKDQEIKQLKLSRQREESALQIGTNLQKEMAKDQQVQRNRMLSLINGQLRLYDLERQRWLKQLQAKEQELTDERESFEQQIESNHAFYKEKILKVELKWIEVEKQLTQNIQKIEKQNIELQETNKNLLQKLEKQNQFEEILKLRRELSKRENQITADAERRQMENQLLRDELERAKSEIKRLKKDNCKLRNDMQTKMFDLEMEQTIAANVEAKRQRSARRKEVSDDKASDKYIVELRKAKKQLSQWERKCKNLTDRNSELQHQIKQLNTLFTERKQNQRRWESLRKEEHQEIQNLNRLFKNIDFKL